MCGGNYKNLALHLSREISCFKEGRKNCILFELFSCWLPSRRRQQALPISSAQELHAQVWMRVTVFSSRSRLFFQRVKEQLIPFSLQPPSMTQQASHHFHTTWSRTAPTTIQAGSSPAGWKWQHLLHWTRMYEWKVVKNKMELVWLVRALDKWDCLPFLWAE